MRKLTGTMLANFRSANPAHANFPVAAVFNIIDTGRIHKEDKLAFPAGIGDLGSKLMQAQNLDVGVGKFAVERIRGAPRDPVIGAERITVGDDQNGRHIRTNRTKCMSF